MSSKTLDRQTVVDAILGAKTEADVVTARQLRDEWIRAHPGDLGVLDAASSLEKVADCLGVPPSKN